MKDVGEIKTVDLLRSHPAQPRSFDDLEQAALAAHDACQRAFDSGDIAEAERWADEFERLVAALWSKVVPPKSKDC